MWVPRDISVLGTGGISTEWLAESVDAHSSACSLGFASAFSWISVAYS